MKLPSNGPVAMSPYGLIKVYLGLMVLVVAVGIGVAHEDEALVNTVEKIAEELPKSSTAIVETSSEAAVISHAAEESPLPVVEAVAADVNATLAAVTVAPVAIATTTRRPFFQGTRAPCNCAAGQCGCCTGVILERFRQKACMNFTYEPDDFAITATMSMNERVLYKNTFSGKNPPPMCIRVPRFRFIELCVEVSNVYFARRNIHMCVDADASWEDFTLVEWSFDCFRLGANGVAVVGPADGGGVSGEPLDEEDQTDEDYDDSARDVPVLLGANDTTATVASSTVKTKVVKTKKPETPHRQLSVRVHPVEDRIPIETLYYKSQRGGQIGDVAFFLRNNFSGTIKT